MLLDSHEQPINVCQDPGCPWWGLSDGAHFDRHNPPCAAHFVAHDGTELLCELLRGHGGPHRGVARRG